MEDLIQQLNDRNIVVSFEPSDNPDYPYKVQVFANTSESVPAESAGWSPAQALYDAVTHVLALVLPHLTTKDFDDAE